MQQHNHITLWGTSVSPYVRKVMAALGEKQLDYTHQQVLPASLLIALKQPVPAEFQQASPFGKIPAVEINNQSLCDSAVITMFLEKNFTSGNKLYPMHAAEQIQAINLERFSDTVLSDVVYKKIFIERVIKPKVLSMPEDCSLVQDALQYDLPPLLQYIDKQLQHKSWLAGNNFSMADISITTQMLALGMAGVEIPQIYPELQRHLETSLARQSFLAISPTKA